MGQMSGITRPSTLFSSLKLISIKKPCQVHIYLTRVKDKAYITGVSIKAVVELN